MFLVLIVKYAQVAAAEFRTSLDSFFNHRDMNVGRTNITQNIMYVELRHD